MRQIENNGALADIACHNGGIRTNSEWAFVRALSVRAWRSPHEVTGATHQRGNQSQRLRQQRLNRNHDVDGVLEFHSHDQRDG